MSDVCIDTDVASRLQKQNAPGWIAPQLLGRRVWITFVAFGELTKLAEVRSWGAPARSRLDAWLAARGVIPLVTLNVRNFEDFATHDGLQLIREP